MISVIIMATTNTVVFEMKMLNRKYQFTDEKSKTAVLRKSSAGRAKVLTNLFKPIAWFLSMISKQAAK